jgi:phage-related holin
MKFKNLKHRKDFISIDKQTVISAEGDIFDIGDEVMHEGDKTEKGKIQSFYINEESMDIIARTTMGTARISFLYHCENNLKQPRTYET